MVPAKTGKTEICPKCGRRCKAGDMTLKEKPSKKNYKKWAKSEVQDTMPKTKEDCPKCKHGLAYWWTIQTRAADEPETQFYRCVKCSYTWRKYL
jgi:DNA-directed RNA polymerase subunit M